MAKERFQSTTLGDEINLDLFSYQNNSLVDLYDIQKVEVYFLDPTQISSTNPDGRRIKAIIQPVDISSVDTGHYRTTITLDDSLYEVGNYIDIWYVKFNNYDQKFIQICNRFTVYTDLRETSDRPFVYDISFSIAPKKIYLGNKKYLRIGFFPTIPPERCEVAKFYYNLKTTGNLFIRIEQIEGCGFNEEFPEMNIKTDPEWSPVEIRGDNEAYFMIDSTDDGDYPIGIYRVQLKVLIDGQDIISPKLFLQIFD